MSLMHNSRSSNLVPLALAGRVLPAQNGVSHGFVFKHLHANLANHRILKIHLSHVQEVLASLGNVR